MVSHTPSASPGPQCRIEGGPGSSLCGEPAPERRVLGSPGSGRATLPSGNVTAVQSFSRAPLSAPRTTRRVVPALAVALALHGAALAWAAAHGLSAMRAPLDEG